MHTPYLYTKYLSACRRGSLRVEVEPDVQEPPAGPARRGLRCVSAVSSGGLHGGVERLDDRAEVRAVHRVLLAAVAERVDRDLGAGAAVEVAEPRAARRSAGHVAGEAVVVGAARRVVRGRAGAVVERRAVVG